METIIKKYNLESDSVLVRYCEESPGVRGVECWFDTDSKSKRQHRILSFEDFNLIESMQPKVL